MARQKGLTKYSGNLGGVSHYRQKGVSDHLARMAGGPSAEQIKNDPAFQRTRENMNEFKASAMAGKAIRQTLAKAVRSMADNFFTGRLTGIMKQINLLDTVGKRGKRGILISQGPEKLEGVDFNQNVTLSSVFSPDYDVTTNADRNEATLDVQPFLPADDLLIPLGATHFRIVLAAASISDIDFDPQEGYGAMNPAEHGLKNYAGSGFLPVDAAVTGVTSLIASLPNAPVLSPGTSLIVAVGVEFYQEVNGDHYLLADKNAMRFEKVFV